jgi:hypothetical protein
MTSPRANSSVTSGSSTRTLTSVLSIQGKRKSSRDIYASFMAHSDVESDDDSVAKESSPSHKLFSDDVLKEFKKIISSYDSEKSRLLPEGNIDGKVSRLFHQMRTFVMEEGSVHGDLSGVTHAESKVSHQYIDELDDLLVAIKNLIIFAAQESPSWVQRLNGLYNGVITYLGKSHPDFLNKALGDIENKLKATDRDIRRLQSRVNKDKCEIAVCCVWGLFQQPLSLGNLCRTYSANLENGEVAICDPIASIKSLYADIKEHNQLIEERERERSPMRQVMR